MNFINAATKKERTHVEEIIKSQPVMPHEGITATEIGICGKQNLFMDVYRPDNDAEKHQLNIHCRHDGIKAGRTDVNGVPRIIKFISEGNVYRLICRSNKPEAEKFETWVFDELLPRIRQTGGYVNDPVVFVDNWLPNTDAKTKALLVTSLEAVKNQDNIIGVQQESVEFHRAVSASVNSVDFGEFAKCLANDRISIGRNRLMAWLRKEKYIDSANVAYQRYIDQEIFEVKETVYYVGTTYHTSRKTLITPKGQVYLAKKVSKEYKG